MHDPLFLACRLTFMAAEQPELAGVAPAPAAAAVETVRV
jgi:hypothetical protein